MMLDWLDLRASGDAIRDAVERALSDPDCRTRDLGGAMTCSEMTEQVIRNL